MGKPFILLVFLLVTTFLSCLVNGKPNSDIIFQCGNATIHNIAHNCNCPENHLSSSCASAYEWRENYGYSWIKGDRDRIPENAVLAGKHSGGNRIYVGRVYYIDTQPLPATVVEHEYAEASWNGSLMYFVGFDVLCGPPVVWQTAVQGVVPPNAIPIGRKNNGEKLYMGRAFHENSVTLGPIVPSHGVLYIPYSPHDIIKTEFDVMLYPELPPH